MIPFPYGQLGLSAFPYDVLEKIQSALHEIAQAQLEIQKVQALSGDITN